MFKKRKKIYFTLAIPLIAGVVYSPAPVKAESLYSGYYLEDSYDRMQHKSEENEDGQAKSGSGRRIASPEANASKEDIQKYVKDSLNSNNGVNEDIKIRGRKQNDDGSYRVALTYYSDDKSQRDLVVEMGKDGVVYDANTAMSDEQLQSAYDAIVYGGGNELSIKDVISINEALHSSTDDYLQNVADKMGVNPDDAAKAASSMVSLAGVVIMGAGAAGEQKKSILEGAIKQAKINQKKKTSGKKGSDGLSSSTGNSDYDAWIKQAANDNGIPPNLLYCLLNQESGFDAAAVSSCGAIGIAQFMPDTAASMGIDPYNPQESISAAARYLKEGYDEFGSWELALAAYNAGPQAVKDAGNQIPNYTETQNYVSSIMSAYQAMGDAPASSDSCSLAHSDTGAFNCCVEGYQYDGLTEPTKEFLNTLTSNFCKETGITVNLTSAYRPDDTNSYHSDGICFDVTADEFDGPDGKALRDRYGEMASELGGTPLDEYPGEPGEVYARGSNFHVSVHDQSRSY